MGVHLGLGRPPAGQQIHRGPRESLAAAHTASQKIFEFFSIEDILATQERVPRQVESDLKNLGFLDPGSDN